MATITTQDSFSCAAIEIVGSVYALMRLDRSATPRFQPVTSALTGLDSSYQGGLSVVGYPAGVPFKISRGQPPGQYSLPGGTFLSDLDTFGADGSAVLNDANELVGIDFYAPDADYVANGSCNVAATCTDAATGYCRPSAVGTVWPARAALCRDKRTDPWCTIAPVYSWDCYERWFFQILLESAQRFGSHQSRLLSPALLAAPASPLVGGMGRPCALLTRRPGRAIPARYRHASNRSAL